MGADGVILIFSLILLSRLDEAELGCHSEMSHGAIDNQFIELVLEEVLLNRDWIVEIVDVHLWEVHNRADVELVDPVRRFAYS